MAIMCFERAGDFYWQRLAKASGLRAAADRMHLSDPEKSRIYIKNAAEIFDSIGKHELAAQSFFEINEYKRAGMLFYFVILLFYFVQMHLYLTLLLHTNTHTRAVAFSVCFCYISYVFV